MPASKALVGFLIPGCKFGVLLRMTRLRRDPEFESISNSAKNVFNSVRGDADNYKLMKTSMPEWEPNEVSFWHSVSC